jgi:hypothetical protein
VVDVVLAHCCDPFTLLAFSATSRLLNSRCTYAARQNFQQLLLAAATACATASRYTCTKDETKSLSTLCWLLQTATTATVRSDTMQQLLSIRHLPAECSTALVKAGVVPTWQQLAAAARNGHCTKQWLDACRKLENLPPGLSALAEAALLADLDFTQPPRRQSPAALVPGAA